MNLNRLILASILVAAALPGAFAQTTRVQHRSGTGTGVAANPQALGALQNDLLSAIQSMESALPIYDGNRVHAIHAAHRALAIVDKSINITAPARPVSKANDKVSSGTAHSKYTQSMIEQSQNSMSQGLASLQMALKDLTAAAGSTPNKKAYEVQKHIAKAVSEANKALNLHASKA